MDNRLPTYGHTITKNNHVHNSEIGYCYGYVLWDASQTWVAYTHAGDEVGRDTDRDKAATCLTNQAQRIKRFDPATGAHGGEFNL